MHDNAALIRRAFALQNAHRADDLAALYADDFLFEDVPLGAFLRDRDEMKKLWLDTWASLSGFAMTPDFILADSSGGAADFVMTGTHSGDFPGYPATGRSFSLKGASIIRIDGGKIVRWSDYWSAGDMERELGLK